MYSRHGQDMTLHIMHAAECSAWDSVKSLLLHRYSYRARL